MVNPAAILSLIASSGGAVQASAQVINQFNTWFGGVNEVQDKVRWLQISVVNLSTDQTLKVEDSWFDSGRFWSQPFQVIQPGTAVTFFVCNRDGGVLTGVSGGVGLQASRVGARQGDVVSDAEGFWWICTFSNPYAGSQKCLTRWKGYGIRPLWEEMQNAAMVRDRRCGCFMQRDRQLVFIWKNPETPWGA